tara:strand:+ start:2575 stop:4113 length:1539 start_codon:yes stop_codon:yes gene_type:complete
MKILCYPTSLNLGYIVDAFKLLKSKNSNIRFGFIYSYKENKSALEIENQNYLKKVDLNASFFNIFSSNKKNDQKLDKKYLNYFESISEKNIWKIISSDRDYGRVYINDIYAYRSKYTKKNNKEILLNFINLSKRIEKIIFKFKPDVVYISNGLSNLEVSILNVLAKHYGAKILVPHPTMYKNYIFFSNDIYVYDEKIKKYYQNNKKNLNLKNLDQLFKETQKKGVVSLDRDTVRKQISKMQKKNILNLIFGDIIYTIFKHSIFQLIYLFGFRYKHLKVLKEYNFIWKIKDEIFLRKMLKSLISIKMPDIKKNYIYLPLHLIPETSTLLKGNDYMNQSFLVELVSKNIPSNCKLYVKEHPAMFTSHARKINFYKRIDSLPNVELVPIYADGMRLIKNSKLVIVVDGSSGFEAMLIKKPVVTLKYFVFSFLGLTITNNNINNLYDDIQKAFKINLEISPKKFERKIKSLITAISETCHQIRKPGFFFYNEILNNEDEKICGEDLAKALINELKI